MQGSRYTGRGRRRPGRRRMLLALLALAAALLVFWLTAPAAFAGL